MSDPHPFVARHVLREARRGKHAHASPDLPLAERAELERVIERAQESGFVRVVHSLGCLRFTDGGRNGRACLCATGPKMELTADGDRELARLELAVGRERPRRALLDRRSP